ncbi:MAG TPA: DUF3168 domain-containing protein [Anaerolineae bacterium]|nr:DUF3168 domain-containing protein [Anaerolineae bacterium]
MGALTAAIYARLAGDATLTALLASYGSNPAIFTVDPAPDNATLPYLVTAGEVSQAPFEAKNRGGREVRRDVRCYTERDDSAVTIEAIAERVRALLHRQPLDIDGFENWVAECLGPIVADEEDAYGRIITVRLILMEAEDGS